MLTEIGEDIGLQCLVKAIGKKSETLPEDSRYYFRANDPDYNKEVYLVNGMIGYYQYVTFVNK